MTKITLGSFVDFNKVFLHLFLHFLLNVIILTLQKFIENVENCFLICKCWQNCLW